VDVAAAAAALILLASGHLLADRYDEIKQSEKFATDYLRTAVVQASPPGFDTEEVGRFYERELGLRIVPVALHDAPVTRATVCDLRGDLGSYRPGGASRRPGHPGDGVRPERRSRIHGRVRPGGHEAGTLPHPP
jgi:hypothetical protein